MKRAKKSSGLYEYLDRIKLLETGTDADILKARKEYWQTYKAAWRKKQRQETKEFTILLSSHEWKQVEEAAKKHKRSTARFIKDSCLAYLSKQYVVPDIVAIHTIRQLLAVNFNALQKLFDEVMLPYQAGVTLLEQMKELESKVLMELYHPKEKES